MNDHNLTFLVAAALMQGATPSTPRLTVGPRRDAEGVPIAGQYVCAGRSDTPFAPVEQWDEGVVLCEEDRKGWSWQRSPAQALDYTAFAAARTFVREAGDAAVKVALRENRRQLRDALESERRWQAERVEVAR